MAECGNMEVKLAYKKNKVTPFSIPVLLPFQFNNPNSIVLSTKGLGALFI